MHVDGLSLKFDAKIAKRISRLSFFIYICAPLAREGFINR